MRPRSRGSVRLAADNPRAPALIDPNYLSEPADLSVLAEGVALARNIGAGAAFAEWREREIYPGPSWANIATQHDFIRRAANSFHHPVGTCRIGSVVDEALRVNPHISNYLKTSGRRISESCCVAITFERFEERPDADRV
jgi:choline dehydrogenase